MIADEPAGWRRYRPQLIALVVGLLAVLGLRIVLQDDDGGPEEARVPSTTVTAPDDDGPPSTPPDDVDRPEDDDTAPEALRAVALRLTDLPSGWSEAAGASSVTLCPDHDPVREVPPEASHQVAFSRGDAGPFVASVVAQFRSEGRAEDFLDAAADAIEDCGRYELDDGRYELDRFTVRGLGDQSVAARITGTNDSGTVDGPIYYVRVGARVVTLALVSIGDDADDLARAAVQAVTERL